MSFALSDLQNILSRSGPASGVVVEVDASGRVLVATSGGALSAMAGSVLVPGDRVRLENGVAIKQVRATNAVPV